jgi:hypothetical protein
MPKHITTTGFAKRMGVDVGDITTDREDETDQTGFACI